MICTYMCGVCSCVCVCSMQDVSVCGIRVCGMWYMCVVSVMYICDTYMCVCVCVKCEQVVCVLYMVFACMGCTCMCDMCAICMTE